MSEFCLDCFNELNDTDYKAKDIWLEVDFCENCAEWKPCVIDLRPKPLFWRFIDLFKKKDTD